jgi:hypothetical protein
MPAASPCWWSFWRPPAAAPAWSALPVNAAGGLVDGGTWRVAAAPTTPPTFGGDRAGSVELGVVIGPAPTRSPTATPTVPTPTATPRTPAPGGGPLPRTGVALGAILLTGAALVAGGAGLRLIARRRREPSAE